MQARHRGSQTTAILKESIWGSTAHEHELGALFADIMPGALGDT